MGFVTRFLNGTSQEIKVKLDESRQLKFYQVKKLEENSTENSAEKNFVEYSQLNELWNISTKLKKKKRKNTQIQRTLFPRHLYKKFATLYIFHPFLSRFFCIKFPLKNFTVCVIFPNQYPN